MKNLKRSQKRRKSSKSNRREVRRITEYIVSGGAYFWTGYIFFFVAYRSLHWGLFWAKISADVVGWVVNYGLQRYWVFNSPALSKHRVDVTKRYLIITGVDFLLDYLIVRELNVAGLTPYLGQFVSAGFFTVWNYLWYKLWVFPSSSPTARRKHA
jgi:putative flippase GtrA